MWPDDLAFGEAGELKGLSYLEYDSFEQAPRRRFKDWDFWIVRKGKKSYWEVKTCRHCHRTGNVVIEFESSGEASGIATTKADFWMYILEYEPTFFMIPVKKLKQMIAAKEYHSIRRIAEGGKNVAYFFDRTLFEDYEYGTTEESPAPAGAA